MSVKGFKLADGTVEKYDYSSLEDIVIDSTLSTSGVAAEAKAVGDKIGNLSNLTTTNKTNLVSAINEVKSSGGGGGGSANILIVTDHSGVLDKNYTEIKTAITSGIPVYVKKVIGNSSMPDEAHRLSPVVAVYRYSDFVYRVAIEQPVFKDTLSGKSNLFYPGVGIYSSDSVTGYLAHYTTLTPNISSIVVNNDAW